MLGGGANKTAFFWRVCGANTSPHPIKLCPKSPASYCPPWHLAMGKRERVPHTRPTSPSPIPRVRAVLPRPSAGTGRPRGPAPPLSGRRGASASLQTGRRAAGLPGARTPGRQKRGWQSGARQVQIMPAWRLGDRRLIRVRRPKILLSKPILR